MNVTIERLIAARDGLKGLNISDYALIREAREAMADAANALASVSAERDEARAGYVGRGLTNDALLSDLAALRTRAETAEDDRDNWQAKAERLQEECDDLLKSMDQQWTGHSDIIRERKRAETAESEAASWKAEAATSFLALGEARELLDKAAGVILGEVDARMLSGDAKELIEAIDQFLSKHGSKGK